MSYARGALSGARCKTHPVLSQTPISSWISSNGSLTVSYMLSMGCLLWELVNRQVLFRHDYSSTKPFVSFSCRLLNRAIPRDAHFHQCRPQPRANAPLEIGSSEVFGRGCNWGPLYRQLKGSGRVHSSEFCCEIVGKVPAP